MPSNTYSARPARRVRNLPDGAYVDQNDRTIVSMLDPAGNVCEVMVNTNRGMDGTKVESMNVDHGYRAVMIGEMTRSGWLPMHPPVGSDAKEWAAKIGTEQASRRAVAASRLPPADPTQVELATAAVQRLREEIMGKRSLGK